MLEAKSQECAECCFCGDCLQPETDNFAKYLPTFDKYLPVNQQLVLQAKTRLKWSSLTNFQLMSSFLWFSKKHEYSMCSPVEQCSANITSWQLVRIVLKQKWTKLLESNLIHYYAIWKSLLKIGLFPAGIDLKFPFTEYYAMKIPIWAVRDTTLRTPWSKPPIVSPTSYHISPPAVFTEYKLYIFN